jgi:O-antigen/teichoic acid export membrane protein
MLSYGGWVSVIGLITPLLTTIDRVLIASLSGAKYLTYYVIPYDLVTKIMIIPGSFSSALFPRLVSGSIDESYNMAISATKTLIAIMTPITIIGLLLIEEFVSLWVGESIAEKSKFIGEILLIGLWVNALVIPTYSRHLARRNPKTIVFIFLFEIPVFLLLLYFGLKFYGIQGAAIAWTLRVCLDTFLILKVNNIFKDIVLTNYLSGIITLAALLLYLLETNLIISFLLSSLLLLVSLVKDKVLLMTTYKELVM